LSENLKYCCSPGRDELSKILSFLTTFFSHNKFVRLLKLFFKTLLDRESHGIV
jgi:hypothetical protein